MVKYLPRALLLALLVGAPVMAQQKNDYRFWRDVFLGQWRNNLMEVCSDGKKFNSRGLSYWDYRVAKLNRDDALKRGEPPAEFDAYQAGKASAMNIACPNVW